jgi:Ribosomal S13/S15 N-terminal domain
VAISFLSPPATSEVSQRQDILKTSPVPLSFVSNLSNQCTCKGADVQVESPWVVCTLPARAFVRLAQSKWYLSGLTLPHTASSALPYRRTPPTWLKTTPDDVVEHIIKLARKGLTPSQIGVTLRDSHGIPQVRFVTGNKILRILKSNGALFHLSCRPSAHTLLLLLLIFVSAPLCVDSIFRFEKTPFVWG